MFILVVYVIDSLWLINIMCIFIWPILGAKVELRGKSFVIGFEFLRYLNVKAVTHHGARTFKKSHYYQGSILLIDLKNCMDIYGMKNIQTYYSHLSNKWAASLTYWFFIFCPLLADAFSPLGYVPKIYLFMHIPCF